MDYIDLYQHLKKNINFDDDATYVDDLVEGLVRLMNNNYTKPVNLGNPDEYKVNDLANIIVKLIGN